MKQLEDEIMTQKRKTANKVKELNDIRNNKLKNSNNTNELEKRIEETTTKSQRKGNLEKKEFQREIKMPKRELELQTVLTAQGKTKTFEVYKLVTSKEKVNLNEQIRKLMKTYINNELQPEENNKKLIQKYTKLCFNFQRFMSKRRLSS